MKKRTLISVPVIAALVAGVLFAQDITTWIKKTAGDKPALAVPDFRGAGDAQPLMAVFNATLYQDLSNSGLFEMKPKSTYPLNNPQQQGDIRPQDGKGLALADWASPPVNATHLVFGFATITNGVFAVYGNVDDTRQQTVQAAQLLSNRYLGSPVEADAIRKAHEFANDIIVKFGGSASLLDSHIYFTSSRGGAGGFGTEIWVMDWDGNNQKQLTHLGAQLAHLAISPDGSRLAFTSWPLAGGQPQIGMVNAETGRKIPFYNQQASLNSAATFTPDGMKLFYSSSASGTPQIYTSALDGQGFTRITSTRGNPTEPKVNPKNPNALLFVDGNPKEQIYRMNSEGSGMERVTNGEGEASNPAWHPDGQHFAYAWTRGYQAGEFNVFVADIAEPQKYEQLTHDGRNENPVWAPDGRYLAYMHTPLKSRNAQIYTMRADGKEIKPLTTQGINRYPVWGVK